VTRARTVDLLACGVLCALGFAASYHYGTRGLMPLDQSIVFDGGWRLLSGQVPFRDFGTPSGLVPIALQALAFAAFGVSWATYVGHAAVVNALFGAATYALLRIHEVDRALALLGALGSTWLLYPPIGTPYAEPHAFAFVLGGCLAGSLAARARDARMQRAWACAAGAFAALAAATKLNVAAAGAMPVLCALALGSPGARSRIALAAAGALATLALALGALFAAGADARMFALYALELPFSAGAPRLAGLAFARVFDAKLIAPMVTLVAIAGALACGPRARTPALALAAALFASSALFLATVVNQPEIGVAPLFAALVLAASALARALPARARAAVLGAAALVLLFDGQRFRRDVVEPRSALDMRFDEATAVHPSAPGLEALWHHETRRPTASARDIDAVLEFLRREPGDFVLIGDHSMLYGLSGRPSLTPSLWFHAGLAHPGPDHPARADYEAALASLPARYAIVEGARTWMGVRIEEFEGLERRLRRPGRRFGAFRVFELEPARDAGEAR